MTVPLESLVHLFAGGVGGTIGAIVTCPLEVVKTRLQSSVATFNTAALTTTHSSATAPIATAANIKPGSIIWRCIRQIIENEGPKALFKGLGTNLIGVAPSRAIYFCFYSSTKNYCNDKFSSPNTPIIHMISAANAGFISCTLTNPIWMVKTRLQLDQSKYGVTTAWTCIKAIHRQSGLTGFYKGITASYFGLSETVIHFVIYEFIKSKFDERRLLLYDHPIERTTWLCFYQSMSAGAISKAIASVLAYPHEVARTRLRQEGNKYKRFFQTIFLVWKEEGIRNGLYRGLGTHFLRQIPNTAIMMATYEVIIYCFKKIQPPQTMSMASHI